MSRPDPVAWLLEPGQPSIRYRTLTELLRRPATDPEVVAARRDLTRVGWAEEILDRREPSGGWGDAGTLYRPKYTSTHWQMLILSDLGVTREDRRVRDACEYWMNGFPLAGGGVGGNSKGTGHHCVVGNMVRALLRMGYEKDPRIPPSIDWLVKTADPKGGWSCFGRGRNLDSWEGLSAFAEWPRERWTPNVRAVVEKAAEFFLERELHVQGGPYAPWLRFHYLVHYYYDVLVGLDVLTSLGYGDDPRLQFAVDLVKRKRRADGRWTLDAVHPDVEGALARWLASHPKDRPTPVALEEVGAPSKMITLRALRVLDRLGPRFR